MSIFVEKASLTKKDEIQLLKHSKVKELRTNFKPFPKTHKLYIETETFYVCPRAIGIPGKSYRKHFKTPRFKILFDYEKYPFTGNGGDNPDDKEEDRNQEETIQLGIDKLVAQGHAFYWFSTGYGKTLCAIETVRRLGRVTLWVVFNLDVQQQTYDELKKFSNAKVEWYKNKKEPSESAQIVIVGLKKAATLPVSFLSRFQTVVLDEVDQAPAKSFFPLFPKICPDYLLGLSATTKKSNGLDKTLHKYFGPEKEFIYRFVTKENVTAIKVQTNFIPNLQIVTNVLGDTQIDKHEIDKSLAENKARNKLIFNLVAEKSKDGQCLVLSPRQENIRWLYDKFAGAGYDVDYKTVGKQNLDKTKRILIAGMMGSARGMDCKAKYVFLLGMPHNMMQAGGRLRDPHGFLYIFIDKFEKFELEWNRKCIPYFRKLECKIMFTVQNDTELSELRPWTVPKKAKEESIIDSYVD